jgi:hypothetical protein
VTAFPTTPYSQRDVQEFCAVGFYHLPILSDSATKETILTSQLQKKGYTIFCKNILPFSNVLL